jgi:TPM domain
MVGGNSKPPICWLINLTNLHSTIRPNLGRIVFIFLLLFSSVFAKPEVINDGVIVDKAALKIIEISKELHEKTGASIVLHAKNNLGGQNIFDYEKNISSSIQGPYVLIVFTLTEQKIDIVVSDALSGVVNKNNILNTYILPILVANDKENSATSKHSAALLNGIGEIADEIAKNQKIELTSSLGSQNQILINIIRLFFYGTIVLAIGFYVYRRFFNVAK